MSNIPRGSVANMEGTDKLGNMPRFGAHLSVAGGLENALAAGAAVGCDCLQIFVKNQRQWRAGPLTDEQVARFREARRATGLAPVVAHASYLLNLASPSDATRAMSISAMVDELTRCEALGVEALVFHPGAHMTAGATKPRRETTTFNPNPKRQRGVLTRRLRSGFGSSPTRSGRESSGSRSRWMKYTGDARDFGRWSCLNRRLVRELPSAGTSDNLRRYWITCVNPTVSAFASIRATSSRPAKTFGRRKGTRP